MVLKPLSILELKNIFDKKAVDILEFQLKKNIISQPEVLKGQGKIGMQIPKEYLEQWCVQALGAKPIGAGSYPVDILKDNWGADIKSLACSLDKFGNLDMGDTGETSLAQNFSSGGVNLDSLFLDKKYDEIKNLWMDIVFSKNQTAMIEKKLDKIYYFIFLRGNEEYYLCGMEVDLNKLSEVTVNTTRSTNTSIFLNEYIESRYGYTKIYKAKKRLELRLKAKNWVEDGLCIKLAIPKSLESVNLRDLDLKEYFFNLLKEEKLIK